MNNEARTLWISLGSGLFAAFLLYSYTQEKKAEYDASFGATVNVVVASKEIKEMTTIDDTMLEIKQMPSEFRQPGVISEPNEAVGQVAAAPIQAGEQILSNKLLQMGPDTGIALQVAPKKRAITLPASQETFTVSKLIRPGDRVDIFAAIDSGKGLNSKKEVVLLMQDVVILATGVNVLNNLPRLIELDQSGKNLMQTTLSGDTKYNALTIEASIEDAQKLIYLITTNPQSLYFTLRNPNDREAVTRMPSTSSEAILGRSSVENVPVPSTVPKTTAPTGPKVGY